MTCFRASFGVKSCKFALFILIFVVVVMGSELLLLTQLSVTFQDVMGCKKGDAIVRSVTDYEVAGIVVCLPSFKMFSLIFLIKFRT